MSVNASYVSETRITSSASRRHASLGHQDQKAAQATHKMVSTEHFVFIYFYIGLRSLWRKMCLFHTQLCTVVPATLITQNRAPIKFLQGNCPQTPTVQGLPLHPRTTSNQCVLRTQDSFLEVPPSSEPAEEPQRLWLDNLYVFNSPSDLSQGLPLTPPTMLTVSTGSELWMTNMDLLGAKEQSGDSAESSEPANISRGMHVLPGAAVYARSTHVHVS